MADPMRSADAGGAPASTPDDLGAVKVRESAMPWDANVKMWGEQRAYSWWLQHALDVRLRDLLIRDREMAEALRTVVRIHAPRRQHDSLGCGASCRACTTGIRTFGDDGPSDHRVEWPCLAVLGIAVALGLGPDPDASPWRYMLPNLRIPSSSNGGSDA